MNRKERRAAEAKARKEGAKSEPITLAERLQNELHRAIGQVVPQGTPPEQVPHAEIIQGLGLIAATFAVQSGVSLPSFLEAMTSYHQGICEALGLPVESPPGPMIEEPEAPSLILSPADAGR